MKRIARICPKHGRCRSTRWLLWRCPICFRRTTDAPRPLVTREMVEHLREIRRMREDD